MKGLLNEKELKARVRLGDIKIDTEESYKRHIIGVNQEKVGGEINKSRKELRNKYYKLDRKLTLDNNGMIDLGQDVMIKFNDMDNSIEVLEGNIDLLGEEVYIPFLYFNYIDWSSGGDGVNKDYVIRFVGNGIDVEDYLDLDDEVEGVSGVIRGFIEGGDMIFKGYIGLDILKVRDNLLRRRKFNYGIKGYREINYGVTLYKIFNVDYLSD